MEQRVSLSFLNRATNNIYPALSYIEMQFFLEVQQTEKFEK